MNGDAQTIQCCIVGNPDGDGSRETAESVALFKALGDTTRLEIFRLIASQPDQICVCHITECFEVSQPTISHHLKVLREAGLISVSRRGVWAYYEVKRDEVVRLQELVAGLAPPVLAGVT